MPLHCHISYHLIFFSRTVGSFPIVLVLTALVSNCPLLFPIIQCCRFQGTENIGLQVLLDTKYGFAGSRRRKIQFCRFCQDKNTVLQVLGDGTYSFAGFARTKIQFCRFYRDRTYSITVLLGEDTQTIFPSICFYFVSIHSSPYHFLLLFFWGTIRNEPTVGCLQRTDGQVVRLRLLKLVESHTSAQDLE